MRATLTAGRRVLALGAAVLVVAATAAIGAGTASSDPVNGSDANGTYLALGDSVAFGYVPPDAVPAPKYLDAHSFVGYPEYLAQQLNERVSNASCPGETTASMLVAGAQSNGCENSPGSPVGYLITAARPASCSGSRARSPRTSGPSSTTYESSPATAVRSSCSRITR